MLCDQIAESIQRSDGYRENGVIRDAALAYYEMVKRANRFILNRDATFMVQNVSEMTPSKFQAALDVCRLPHRLSWIEFVYKDRADWLAGARARGMPVQSRSYAGDPSRVGFLIEQLDDSGQEMLVHPSWVHMKGDVPEVSLCYMGLRVNTRPDFVSDMTPEEMENLRRSIREKPSHMAGYQKWASNPKDLEAAVILENRIKMVVPPWMQPLWDAVAKSRPDIRNQLEEMARFDLASEWRFVLSLLTILNSRNLVRVGEERTFEKINKKRQGTKKPPLLSHRDIILSLSKVQKNRVYAAAGYGNRVMDVQSVIGHYKVRKTGIFWWSPHFRGGEGEAGSLGPRTYQVRG